MRRSRNIAPALAGLFLLGLVAACDEAINVNREYPSTLGEAHYLQSLPPVIPVHLDAVPAEITPEIQSMLEQVGTELTKASSGASPVRFALGRIPDGRDFALRIAMQPLDELSALSLCQGRPIGRLNARQKSMVVIAAVCDNRRRLGEVRAIHSPDQNGEAVAEKTVIEAAVRKLFAL